MSQLKEGLVQIGFSQKEAQIYLAMLQLGNASVNHIAQEAGINRVTAYSIIDALCARNLVSIYHGRGERRYSASSPNHIDTLLFAEQKNLDEKREVAHRILPALNLYHDDAGFKPRMRYFEGQEGLALLQEEYEHVEGDILQIIGYDHFTRIKGIKLRSYQRRTSRKKPRKMRSILITETPVHVTDMVHHQFRTISPDLIDMAGEMTVCGNRVIFFSFDAGILAVEIISKNIADTARGTLELAWRQAEKWS